MKILSSNKVRAFPLHKIPKEWSGKDLPAHGSFLFIGHSKAEDIKNFTLDEIVKHCEANDLDMLYSKGFLEFEKDMTKIPKGEKIANLIKQQ